MEKGWSQRELASASGISNAEISRIESGKRKTPSFHVLDSFAKALGVPAIEMYLEAGMLEGSIGSLIAAKNKRIAELEAENERLRTLLERRKI